jgi:hypothetical protein
VVDVEAVVGVLDDRHGLAGRAQAGDHASRNVVLPAPELPQTPITRMPWPRSVLAVLGHEGLDHVHAGGHHGEALGQRLDAFELGGTARLAAGASTMVSANLAGSAVSSTIIGTPASTCSAATFTPSAVWVSIRSPKRSKVLRMVARRSAWVLRPTGSRSGRWPRTPPA